MKFNRIFMVVTDGLGIGGDKRQEEFGDKGANTLLAVSGSDDFSIPTWKKFGIDSIAKIEGHNKAINQTAYMARTWSHSNAKDTLAGHWEMMGQVTEIPFPVFTENGFPADMVAELEKGFDGRKIVGNKSASGTTIIDEHAEDEINNNGIIVYTSGDSVLQICGHEESMGLDNLYKYGEWARKVCDSKPEWQVGRIIVRPYVGTKGNYKRTANRHDYAVEPMDNNTLERLQKAGVNTVGVGKIHDIFTGKGINEKFKGKTDLENMDIAIDLATKKTEKQFIFVNLVQFDSDFGHRRDIDGYARNLAAVDTKWAKLAQAMNDDDLLIITSDHGNSPAWPGSDHTREEVPVTMYSPGFTGKPKALETFEGFATSGNLVARNFGVELSDNGQDRFDELI